MPREANTKVFVRAYLRSFEGHDAGGEFVAFETVPAHWPNYQNCIAGKIADPKTIGWQESDLSARAEPTCLLGEGI